MEDVSRVVRTQGTNGVSNWAGLGTGSGEGAPARPDPQRQGKDSHAASSSAMSSFTVAASAIIGISHIGVETVYECSAAGRGCQHARPGRHTAASDLPRSACAPTCASTSTAGMRGCRAPLPALQAVGVEA